jgi:hypothetical protein
MVSKSLRHSPFEEQAQTVALRRKSGDALRLEAIECTHSFPSATRYRSPLSFLGLGLPSIPPFPPMWGRGMEHNTAQAAANCVHARVRRSRAAVGSAPRAWAAMACSRCSRLEAPTRAVERLVLFQAKRVAASIKLLA